MTVTTRKGPTAEPLEVTTDRDAATRAVWALQDRGRVARLASCDDRIVAVDLDAPYVEIVDALIELYAGDDERAEAAAHRLVRA